MSRIANITEITVQRGPFEMIPHWLLDTQVSSHAVRLYLILRRHGNDRGVCFPGRKRLAIQLGVSTSTIDRARAELAHAGAICYRTRMGTDGDYTSNEYHVHWFKLDECGFYVDEGYPACDDTPPAGEDRGMVTGDELTKTQLNLDPPKEYIDRFEDFWNVYPKKVARKKAHEAWKRVTRKHNRQMLIEAAQAYRDDPNRDPEFTLNPTTWMNQERWEDEVEKPKPSGPVTVMDLYAAEPCEHGDPMGEARCALCRNK